LDNPLVSIIIVNFNGKKFLQPNLNSVNDLTYDHFEIIMIDNASVDGSVEYIKKQFPKIKLIENRENLGFIANNQGMQIATGEYIFLLNNDTIVEPNLLTELLNEAEKDQSLGMIAPKILTQNHPEIIDGVGINICIDGMSRQRGRLEKDVGQYDQVEEILLPSGCAVLYRKQMLDEIGYFDEDFFAYCEDTDLGFRGRLAGWKAIFVPTARLYHYGSGSTEETSPFKAFLVERNHFWFAFKCFPLDMLLLLPFVTLYRYFFQLYALLTKKGMAGKFSVSRSKGNLALILIRSILATLGGLPKMLEKRKVIQKNRQVSRQEIRSWFIKFKHSIKDLVLTG